ncbi:hypothetical protein NQ317_002851 [Molorchus minor]|uniref:U-box domain-containing protein n=1 Tax=Molorchus minor TaxID=1323400 RepID=A0ABQ9JVC9_9CUCU|nr:hypothetical protein NQ317_002851 [Molorchus minor]
MFNFVDSKLTPKLICKSAAMDNYEAENLISDNYLKRMRGFTSICKAVYDKPGIVFCNSRKYSSTNQPNCNPEYHLAFFKSNTFKYFLNANAIKIVIFRTEKSLPCLGSVEVWGTPSKSCSAVTIRTINYIMKKSHLNESESASTDGTKEDHFKIPDDFKDDLTYEIMTIPMTLPSGKTVDQSTLDKHIKNEISFGRRPCDPFTGIKFTDKIKPIMNVALKSRIDMFLLQNSHMKELDNVKRTLGRASSSSAVTSPIIYSGSDTSDRKRKLECSDDLDKIITRAKQNPSFINFNEQSAEKHCCLNCSESSDTLYEILCSHRYCRPCMLATCKRLKCSVCNKSFSNSDVRKCNL